MVAIVRPGRYHARAGQLNAGTDRLTLTGVGVPGDTHPVMTRSPLTYPGSELYDGLELATPGVCRLERPRPIARVDDIAWVRFVRPDLDLAARFLEDFGLVVAHRTADRLYLRGAGPHPVVYVAERGPAPRYVGAGFHATSRADLERLAAEPDASPIEALDAPGDGERVRLYDPSGFQVEVVWGATPAAPLPMRREPLPVNTPFDKRRVNRPQRPPLEPACVVRLGHAVVRTPCFLETVTWYMRTLGLIPSDVQCLDDGVPALAFLRADRGAEPADHHAVVVADGPDPGHLHSAFEVLDVDALGQGQQVLRAAGWTHAWGIGRHQLGSQLFDYWCDPWGDEIEHFTDGDVFDASHPTGYSFLDRGSLWMWGEDLPASFVPRPSAGLIARLTLEALRGRADLGRLSALQRAVARKPRPWLA